MVFFFKSKKEKLEIEKSKLEKEIKLKEGSFKEFQEYKEQLETSLKTALKNKNTSPIEIRDRRIGIEGISESIFRTREELELMNEKLKQINQQLSQINKKN